MEKILLIDDDEGLIHFLSRFFERKGYSVATCADGPCAIEKIGAKDFDLILLDYKMPELNGLDTLNAIKEIEVKTPVILMTAYGTTELAIEAMKRGAYDYLVKPFERKDLSRIVREALQVNRQMKEVVRLPESAEPFEKSMQESTLQLIGSSRRMQEIYKLIGQIAEKDVPVFITGESGTGKELVAKAIYHHSCRKEKPFMALNCAAIPESLFESELFGHERGAFTGADRTYIGKMERCHGGTLFLDEIGEMPVALQAKLLRVLQENEIERLGSTQTVEVDVRIIAATNKDLSELMAADQFRQDLYYRVNVVRLALPPLRHRMEDIPLLVDRFISKMNLRQGKFIQGIDQAVLAALMSHTFPGNIRELENIIEHAFVLCQEGTITWEHLPGFLAAKPACSGKPSDDPVKTAQINLISDALARNNYNRNAAAKDLGIHKSTLFRRIKKLGIKL